MAWAIALPDRYRFDRFFRTELNVIVLQMLFALAILGSVWFLFSLLYDNISKAITQGIQVGAETGSSVILASTIADEISQIKSQNIALIASVIIALTLIFGYLVARMTLRPTREALSAQKQFIGNIAHELRTPLAIIKTNTEVALLDTDLTDDLKAILTSNIEETDRISQIINNLLSISALARPASIEFKPVNMAEIVAMAMKKYSALAQHAAIQVTVHSVPQSYVWGNATALEQIVSNVFKNAIQYTPHGGRIRITIEHAPQRQIEVMIQDSGIGISRKDLFRIFEPFYRTDPSRVRAGGGSGLGLTIVNELLKAHSGKITVRSVPGQGTTVRIFLPASEVVASTDSSEESNVGEVSVDYGRDTVKA